MIDRREAIAPSDDIATDMLMAHLIGRLSDEASVRTIHRDETVTFYRQAVEKVLHYMKSNLSHSLSLEELAEVAYISPYHFHRVFSEVTGISPGKFLTALRIQKARDLVLQTDAPIIEICYESGYNSVSAFTTTFTELVGTAPTRLRLLLNPDECPLRALVATSVVKQQKVRREPSLRGRIVLNGKFQELIFVGVFPTGIPCRWPVAGGIFSNSNYYSIHGVPDGVFKVFGAAFGSSNVRSSDLLAPHPSFVARCRSSISVENGVAKKTADLVFRPSASIDPPILTALSLLLPKR